jgi:hypothetical protein
MQSNADRDTKPVRISAQLHSEIKAEAALGGEKLKELVERKLRGSSHDRRKALRKWDKIRANKAQKAQEWVRSKKV